MTKDDPFPELIAARAATAVHGMVAGDLDDPQALSALGDLVRRSVLQAFGCTCPPDVTATSPGRRNCSLHGSLRHARRADEPVMESRATSWEDDPYDGYTTAERREGVQETVRTATEFLRVFRSQLAATLPRARTAQDQIEDAVMHANRNGGLAHREMESAETALSAVQYALRLLYIAGNHVGDQPGSDQYR